MAGIYIYSRYGVVFSGHKISTNTIIQGFGVFDLLAQEFTSCQTKGLTKQRMSGSGYKIMGSTMEINRVQDSEAAGVME